MVTFGTLSVSAPVEAAGDPLTADVGDALTELGAVIGAVSQVEELAEAIPLTAVAPGGAGGLDLLTSLGTATMTLETALADSMDGPTEIADEIEDADTTVGSVDVTFGCPDGADPCAESVSVVDNAGVIDYHIPVTVTTTVDPTLVFESDVFDMDGNTFPVDLSMSTVLDLRFDTNVPDDRFSLVTPPTISITVEQGASVPNPIVASSRIGVADVSVSSTGLDLDVGFTVTMIDPDGLGGLTQDEWMSTQIADLVAETNGVTRTGSIGGTLNFDTDLIDGVGDGSIDIGDDLSNGFDFMLDPDDLGSLVNFTLISPAAIIAGIGQAAAALGGAQAIGDVPLPFLDGGVREIAQASRPILDAVDALGVVCGSEGAGNANAGRPDRRSRGRSGRLLQGDRHHWGGGQLGDLDADRRVRAQELVRCRR